MSIIKAIDQQTVHQICSGQVIQSMSSVVKELIENSIDAKATRIEILFRDDGMDLIQISDNGHGVHPSNYDSIVKKHHTSKISSFEDLSYVTSFGFRGEALSSLCALCNLTIVTRTKTEALATLLRYDHDNILIERQESAMARDVGTTVFVQNIFKNFPVRHTHLKKNLKREYAKCIDIIEAYGLISTGLRLTVHNQPSNQRNRKSVLNVNGSSLKDNISTILGSAMFKKLQLIDYSESDYRLHGYISKVDHGSGRSSSDRQYLFLNGRPVDLERITKLINSIYKQYNVNQYPIFVINITMKTDAYDINVTPDKRKVFLEDETSMLTFIKEAVEKLYSPESRTLKMNVTTIDSFILRNELKQYESMSETITDQPAAQSPLKQRLSQKRKYEETVESAQEEENGSGTSEDESPHSVPQPKKRMTLIIRSPTPKKPKLSLPTPAKSDHSHKCDCSDHDHPDETPITEKSIPFQEDASASNYNLYSPPKKQISKEQNVQIILDSEIKKSVSDDPEQPVHVSISTTEVLDRFRSVVAHKTKLPSQNTKIFNARMQDGNQTCEAELSKKLSKQDFTYMKILGQFNKGFIITELDNNLFIIDQHASDEKYNYEDLQANTKMNTQPLIL